MLSESGPARQHPRKHSVGRSRGSIAVLLLVFLPGTLYVTAAMTAAEIDGDAFCTVICFHPDQTTAASTDRQIVALAMTIGAIGFLFILPGFFVASSVGSANEAMTEDFHAKSLESVRINPNQPSYKGVVFFEIPPDQQNTFSMEDAFLEVKVYKQGKGEERGKVFETPVHFFK